MEIVNLEKLLLKIIRILDKLGLDYFVTGGLAVSVWGRPRATFDIDIVIELVEPEVNKLAKAVREIFKAGYIDEEMMQEAIKHRSEFNFIDPKSNIKVDFWIKKDDELAIQEFKRKRAEKIGGQNVFFISPEDLIISKLLWYKESESTRQLEDVESILKISQIDLKYLKAWAKQLDISRLLNKLLKKTKPEKK